MANGEAFSRKMKHILFYHLPSSYWVFSPVDKELGLEICSAICNSRFISERKLGLNILVDLMIGALGSLIASAVLYILGRRFVRKNVLKMLRIYEYPDRLLELHQQLEVVKSQIDRSPRWIQEYRLIIQ